MTTSLAVITAVNDEAVLRNNLAASPMFKEAGIPLVIERGHKCAGAAYNSGIVQTDAEVLIFAHQDVFLPAGWDEKLIHYIKMISNLDPQWGVLGLYGVTHSASRVGYVYSTGLCKFVGSPFREPIKIRTLDEVVLIIKRISGLRFDEYLPGFHLYGTDISLEAESRGMTSYVVPCFALHNSNGIKRLPSSYWKSYMYTRRKWCNRLPIETPCTIISNSYSPIIRHMAEAWWLSVRGMNSPGSRVEDPKRFYDLNIATVVANEGRDYFPCDK